MRIVGLPLLRLLWTAQAELVERVFAAAFPVTLNLFQGPSGSERGANDFHAGLSSRDWWRRSASRPAPERDERWMLKQVQHDE
jgi:hypothetical protein